MVTLKRAYRTCCIGLTFGLIIVVGWPAPSDAILACDPAEKPTDCHNYQCNTSTGVWYSCAARHRMSA